MIRLHERTMHVAHAKLKIALELNDLQLAYDLTDVEMLQAVNDWIASVLKRALRVERGDADSPADEEKRGEIRGDTTAADLRESSLQQSGG